MPPGAARIVIIGGGIMGCSVAYHLSQLGEKDVVLLEQGRLTSGTTWHAAGLVGQLRAHESMTRLIRYSTDLYAKLEAETGLATGWKPCGSLAVARTADRMTQLKRTAAVARAYGVACDVIGAAEAGKLFPLMRTDDLQGAVWLPGDGKANPADLTLALAKGARNRGVKVFEGVRVTEPTLVDTDGRRSVRALEWSDKQGRSGTIAADVVVLCGGQWSRELGRRMGVTVPLFSCEHFYIVTDVIPGVFRDLPVMRDPDGYIYFKEEVGGLLMGGFEPDATPWLQSARHRGGIPENFEFQLLPDNWDAFQILMENAILRVPALETAQVKQFYNGPESFTADNNFILGPAPGLDERLGRRRLQLDGHRVGGRRRQGARRVDRAGRADARPVAGRHPPLRALQRQRELAARPHQGSAGPALQDAVAEPRARQRAAVPPLAAVRAPARRGRLLRLEDGMGARQLLRALARTRRGSSTAGATRTGTRGSPRSTAPAASASRSST